MEIINSSPIYLSLLVVALVVAKYGVLGFVLSRMVKGSCRREQLDSAFTLAVLVILLCLNRDAHVDITHDHIGLNICYTLLAIVLYYAVQIFVGEKLGGDKSQNQLRIEQLTREVPFGLSLLATGLLAPIFEEVVFRYYIQDLIFGNTLLGLCASSLLFAALHLVSGFSWSALCSYFGVSLVVGGLYILSGGLLFSSIMHVMVNSLAVVLMYYGGRLKELSR